MLIALLSQHDLSTADRRWIQGKIDALKDEEEGDAAEALLPPARPPYTVKGASQPLRASQAASIDISPVGTAAANLVCNIGGAATQPVVSNRSGGTSLTWTPDRAGAFVLDCRAGKYTERRILRVVANN